MDSESIFVSYSSTDRPFALEFAKELQNLGVNVWIDQLGIKLGENWDNAIEEALEKSNSILLFISPTSAASQNVQDEVNIGINTKKKLIPILIKQCDLPMRWQRLQYADLTHDPNKGLKSVIEALGLKATAEQKLTALLSFIGVSEESQKKIVNKTEIGDPEPAKESAIDLLISETEIDRATDMHKRGIKKNIQLIVFVAVLSIVLALALSFFDLGIPMWVIIVGCLSINLLSVRPFGGIKKRERKIDLMGLLKLKRDRLIRIANKLTDHEINDFNEEFDNCIAI